jgi:hypothetical protein
LAEVVGQGVGGGDGLAGLDLDGSAAAGCLDEFPDGPAGSRFDPPADGEGREDDRQVGFDGVALAVENGGACRSDFDILKLFSISKRR